MGLLCDNKDPTTALFLSQSAAQRAAALVMGRYSDRVDYCRPSPRTRQGEMQGYALIVHFKDKRPATPLTNSDFERITGA